MKRTMDRPLPAGRMSLPAALLGAGVSGLAGITLLWWAFGPVAAVLGALSLLGYAFVYTPLKRISPAAVFVGAIPGAMPPLIGWAAATGSVTEGALALFAIQFFWQFPHFWAIAWVARDDYARAGFDLLPDRSGRTRASAAHVVIYTAMLLPMALLPWAFGVSGAVSTGIAVAAGVAFTAQALVLYQRGRLLDARRLMFGSFVYLPVVFTAFVLDKV